MKTSLFLFLVFYCSVSFGQNIDNKEANKEILLDNNKMKVVKYVGKSQGEVCGNGMHHHEAHLTVALTDAKVLITSPDGKKQEVEIPAEAAIWFEAGTHEAINTGDTATKFLLVYLKE
jgi:hypothetical protein